jgi:hypothetical protein
VAASQIHIAGQQGSRAAKILFGNMGFGGLVYLLGQFNLFNSSRDFIVSVGQLGKSFVRLGRDATSPKLSAGAVTTMSAPAVSPAYLGVGYIIGPRLASLNFAGGVIAWGLLVPLILFLGGPTFVSQFLPPGATPATPSGPAKRTRSGNTSSSQSQWAACWWAPATHFFACGRTCPAAWRAPLPI